MKYKNLFCRYLTLVVGVFFIGLGIALARRSELGISPVSSVANVLSIRFDFFSVGTWLMLWNCAIILAEILILRRQFKPIELLQFPISLLLGVFTDVGVKLVSVLPNDIYVLRLGLVLVGVVVLAFGMTLTILSGTVMNVGEAFVNLLANKLHKNFGDVKVVFDISCVAMSILLSMLFFDGAIVGAREGTVITACLSGFIVKFMKKALEKRL